MAEVTHGPIAYGVTSDSAIIFCRTDVGAEVQVKYSTNPDLSDPEYSDTLISSLDADFTLAIALNGLETYTKYYYTFVVDDVEVEYPVSPYFVTFPEATADHSFVVIADACDQPAGVLKAISVVDPSFVMQLGDFDHSDPAKLSTPPDIEDWRDMHKRMTWSSAFGKHFMKHVGRKCPVYGMWDDHDYGINNSDKTAEWKPIATQAFREYHPNVLTYPAEGNWYKFAIAHSECFVLDLRSQRDPNVLPDDENKSMLGAEQKQWLFDGLTNSTATWKFIFSSVPFNPTVTKDDCWNGFQTERAEIVEFINSNQVEGVIVISADLHTGGAIDDGTNSTFSEMSVPYINFHREVICTASYCGTWSEGRFSGVGNPGLGHIEVFEDTVILTTWAAVGANQISLVVTA